LAFPREILRKEFELLPDGGNLGHGAHGVVFKGYLHDGNKKLDVAIKKGNKLDSNVDPNVREINTLLQLKDAPNVIFLYGYCTSVNGSKEELYMIMERMDQNLEEAVEDGLVDLIFAMREVANALVHLHGKKLIHRDIKPANILVYYDKEKSIPEVKLSDFGCAKYYKAGGPQTALVGTRGFAPPKSWKEPSSFASDILAFAKTFLSLCKKKPARRITTQYPQFVELMTQCSKEKEPSKRPTAADLYSQLDAMWSSRQPLNNELQVSSPVNHRLIEVKAATTILQGLSDEELQVVTKELEESISRSCRESVDLKIEPSARPIASTIGKAYGTTKTKTIELQDILFLDCIRRSDLRACLLANGIDASSFSKKDCVDACTEYKVKITRAICPLGKPFNEPSAAELSPKEREDAKELLKNMSDGQIACLVAEVRGNNRQEMENFIIKETTTIEQLMRRESVPVEIMRKIVYSRTDEMNDDISKIECIELYRFKSSEPEETSSSMSIQPTGEVPSSPVPVTPTPSVTSSPASSSAGRGQDQVLPVTPRPEKVIKKRTKSNHSGSGGHKRSKTDGDHSVSEEDTMRRKEAHEKEQKEALEKEQREALEKEQRKKEALEKAQRDKEALEKARKEAEEAAQREREQAAQREAEEAAKREREREQAFQREKEALEALKGSLPRDTGKSYEKIIKSYNYSIDQCIAPEISTRKIGDRFEVPRFETHARSFLLSNGAGVNELAYWRKTFKEMALKEALKKVGNEVDDDLCPEEGRIKCGEDGGFTKALLDKLTNTKVADLYKALFNGGGQSSIKSDQIQEISLERSVEVVVACREVDPAKIRIALKEFFKVNVCSDASKKECVLMLRWLLKNKDT